MDIENEYFKNDDFIAYEEQTTVLFRFVHATVKKEASHQIICETSHDLVLSGQYYATIFSDCMLSKTSSINA